VNGYLEPDLSSAVLLTIDAQRDFTLPGTVEVVPGMRRLVRAFRQSNRPVVHA
jgi:nicotinamidase-related amidase